MNSDRAQSAANALRHYGIENDMDEDEETLSIDLITDLLHLLHSMEIDPEKTIEMANMHFEAEAT